MSFLNIERRVSRISSMLLETYAEEGRQRELVGKYGTNFAFTISLSALKDRREHLLQILSLANAELDDVRAALKKPGIVNLSLSGEYFKTEYADIQAVSQVISYFQRLYTSVVQALSTGPTERGSVGQSVANMSRLRMITTFPSSFGISLERESKEESLFKELDVADEALDVVLSILEEGDFSEISGALGGLGIRTINNYRRFVHSLSQYDTDFKVFWGREEGKKEYSASRERIKSLDKQFSSLKISESRLIDIEGEMHTASLSKGTFEIRAKSGQNIRGRFIGEALESVRLSFGKDCAATLIYTETHDEMSDKTKPSFILQSVKLL